MSKSKRIVVNPELFSVSKNNKNKNNKKDKQKINLNSMYGFDRFLEL